MTAINASGPIAFTDRTTGRQYSIPLSALEIDDSGVVQPKVDWPPTAADGALKANINTWLAYLTKAGAISRRATPPPPAMVIAAADGGASGNSIEITFKNVTGNKFDVDVLEVDSYPDLTAATIEAVLGKLAGSGQKPGLVFVSSATPPSDPGKVTAAPLVTAAPGTAAASLDVKKGTTVAFTLQAKNNSADGAKTEVTIPTPSGGKFNLEARWSGSATQITAAEMDAHFGYIIKTTAPPGRPFGVPAEGKVTLSGGADPTPPAKASATVLSNG